MVAENGSSLLGDAEAIEGRSGPIPYCHSPSSVASSFSPAFSSVREEGGEGKETLLCKPVEIDGEENQEKREV